MTCFSSAGEGKKCGLFGKISEEQDSKKGEQISGEMKEGVWRVMKAESERRKEISEKVKCGREKRWWNNIRVIIKSNKKEMKRRKK